MSNQKITKKIEALKLQIQNFNKEIEKLTLEMNLYGMTYEEYQKRKILHDYYFSRGLNQSQFNNKQ